MTPTPRLPRLSLRRLAAATVLLAVLGWMLWPNPRLVDIATVDRGPVLESFEAEGRTRVRDRYLLSAPVAASARRLDLQPGDPVRAGQVLVVLDPLASTPLDPRSRAEAEARLASAESRLQSARAAENGAEAMAQQAQADARRAQTLAGRDLLAASEAERLHSAARVAERALASARFQTAASAHETELAAAALQRPAQPGLPLPLKAPVDGVLLRRYFESARPVAVGEPLLELGELGSLEVEVDVLSADAVRLAEGMKVDLLHWGETAPLAARVRRIEPGGFSKVSTLGVEEQRVWVKLSLESPRERWQRLGDAYRVTARFRLRETADALRVPASAVFRQGEGWAVFRLEGGRARLQVVEIGLQGGGMAEIRAGLRAGERVIIHPERELAAEDRVRPR